MKKYILLALTVLVINTSLAFGNSFQSQYDTLTTQINSLCSDSTSLSNKESRKSILTLNLKFFEANVHKKIKRAASNIERNQQKLKDCKDEEKMHDLLKKIENDENKMKDLHDMLLGLEVLKARFN